MHTYSTKTLGRAICNARNHHFVADHAGGEEVGAGELFSGCCPLDWMDVEVAAYRDPDKAEGELTLYDAIRISFEMWGVDNLQARRLVEIWKRR